MGRHHRHGQLHTRQSRPSSTSDGPSFRGGNKKSSNKKRTSPQEAFRLQNPFEGSNGCCPLDRKLCSASTGFGALFSVEDLAGYSTSAFTFPSVDRRLAALL